ncbi:MAG: 30S ribosomal protein S9 [archaeon]
MKKEKIVIGTGKKKTAVARARIRKGENVITVNGRNISTYSPLIQEIIREPIILANFVVPTLESLDIKVNVSGGGVMSQAYAARTAIGAALLEWTESEELKKVFNEYNRNLFVSDTRRKEPKKYLRKGARAKPTKSYR